MALLLDCTVMNETLARMRQPVACDSDTISTSGVLPMHARMPLEKIGWPSRRGLSAKSASNEAAAIFGEVGTFQTSLQPKLLLRCVCMLALRLAFVRRTPLPHLYAPYLDFVFLVLCCSADAAHLNVLDMPYSPNTSLANPSCLFIVFIVPL